MVPARIVFACVVVAAAAVAGEARADDALDLTWSTPPACPGRDAVLAEVRRLLGGRLASKAGRLAVDALVTADEGGYHLRLTTRGDGGEHARTLAAPTCEEIADATSLMVAMALDPEAVTAGGITGPAASAGGDTAGPSSTPAPSPSASTSAPAAPASAPVAAPSPAVAAAPLGSTAPPRATRLSDAAGARPPTAREWTFAAYAGAAGDLGTFRDATAVARAGVAAARKGGRFEATGLFAWAGRVTVAAAPTKGGELWLAGAAFSVGGDGTPRGRGATLDALRLTGAAGIELGVQGASGFGVDAPGHGEAPWIAPFGTAVLRWAIAGRLRLRADTALVVPLVRPEFVLTNVGLVQQAGPVAGRLSLGLELDAAFF